jgi:hypothetical protein
MGARVIAVTTDANTPSAINTMETTMARAVDLSSSRRAMG